MIRYEPPGSKTPAVRTCYLSFFLSFFLSSFLLLGGMFLISVSSAPVFFSFLRLQGLGRQPRKANTLTRPRFNRRFQNPPQAPRSAFFPPWPSSRLPASRRNPPRPAIGKLSYTAHPHRLRPVGTEMRPGNALDAPSSHIPARPEDMSKGVSPRRLEQRINSLPPPEKRGGESSGRASTSALERAHGNQIQPPEDLGSGRWASSIHRRSLPALVRPGMGEQRAKACVKGIYHGQAASSKPYANRVSFQCDLIDYRIMDTRQPKDMCGASQQTSQSMGLDSGETPGAAKTRTLANEIFR
jgi:hypothetical protein